MPLSRKPTVTMAAPSPDRNGGVRFVQVGRELDGLGSRIQDPVRGSQEVISHGDGIVERDVTVPAVDDTDVTLRYWPWLALTPPAFAQ